MVNYVVSFWKYQSTHRSEPFRKTTAFTLNRELFQNISEWQTLPFDWNGSRMVKTVLHKQWK